MNDLSPLVTRTLQDALSGRRAHVDGVRALEGLEWRLAGERPGGVPHSVFRTLRHLLYWQDLYLEWLGGGAPAWPEHDPEGWPGEEAPADAAEWETTALQAIQAIAAHNSYHLGQIVLIRRMLGAWPPPGGGDSW
jgi:uncharacterized damage-inducible protein DinB